MPVHRKLIDDDWLAMILCGGPPFAAWAALLIWANLSSSGESAILIAVVGLPAALVLGVLTHGILCAFRERELLAYLRSLAVSSVAMVVLICLGFLLSKIPEEPADNSVNKQYGPAANESWGEQIDSGR